MANPSSFAAHHVERSGRIRLPMAPADALPWFTPEGERAWAPGWTPEYLHPPDGVLGSGLTFSTRVGGELTHGLLLAYDEVRRAIDYVRIVPDSRFGTVSVRCVPAGSGGTEVLVTYRLTAVSDQGNTVLEALTPDAFERMLRDWEERITTAGTRGRGARLTLEFSTPRLWLRPYELRDVEALHRLWTEPLVRRYLWDDAVISRDRAAAVVRASLADWRREQLGQWTIWPRAGGPLVGFCGFRRDHGGSAPELLYGLATAYWGRGLATEAAEAALRYAFDTLGLTEVWAATDPPNLSSIRVLERLGMRFERTGELDGQPTVFYRLGKREYPERHGGLEPQR